MNILYIWKTIFKRNSYFAATKA